MTDTWHTTREQREDILAATVRQLTTENVKLEQALAELERRVARATGICRQHFADGWARRIHRILEGDRG